jgi:hypothetical protein
MKFKPPKDTPVGEPVSIGLTSGHTIVIDAKGTNVQAHFRRAAIAAGCVPVGMGTEDAEITLDAGDVRISRIKDGIEKLLDGDEDDNFGADGKPDARKLSKIVGFTVSRSERDEAWTQFEADTQGNAGDAGDGE